MEERIWASAESVAKTVQDWILAVGAKITCISPVSP
jgi:hypothetical protein